MRHFYTLNCLPLLAGLWFANASADQATLPDCPATAPYLACQTTGTSMPRAPHYNGGARILRHGETLDFYWLGAASAVRVEGMYGNYGVALHPLAANEWAASVHVPHLASLTEHFTFVATIGGDQDVREAFHFDGPDARPIAPRQQAVQFITLPSRHLPEGRQVSIWLPPGHATGQRYPVVYIADGAAKFGDELLDAMSAGRLPAMVIVGLDPDPSARFAEYVDFPRSEGMPSDPERFAAHERFVIEELLPWAESTFGAAQEAESRIVAGFSNGADWAAAMALRHPDLFGRAIVMSPIMVSQYAIPDAPDAHFDLSAGALEPPFALATACFAQRLHAKGGTVKLRWWPHTHAPAQWRAAFATALLDQPADRIPDGNTCDMFRQGEQ